MVRGRIGLVESDDEAATRAQVAAGVAQLGPRRDRARWIEHALLVLLGLEGSAGAAREELFSAWRTFFERIAAPGRSSSCSRTSTGPTPACSTSSTTSSTGARGVPI